MSAEPSPRIRPIGVFDSGVGGLTVVHELRRRFPREHILYLGDTARVPYGTKSPRTVERYALNCQRFLLERHVKLVMVACNTASANALPALVAAAPVPVVGAVEPGAISALRASTSKHIAVLGTLGTVRSGAYEAAIRARDGEAQVVARPCPLFVPLAEEGWGESEVAEMVARRYLHDLFRKHPRVDVLVLGCTHYPLLRTVLQKVCDEEAGHAVRIVDSASAMCERAREIFDDALIGEESGPASGTLECCVTDATRMDELAPRFLGEGLSKLELVDL